MTLDRSTGSPRSGAAVAAAARLGRATRSLWPGWAFTLGTLVVMLSAVWLRQGHEEFPGSTLLIFSLAAWLPLVVRTRWPLGVLVATVVVESLHLALVPFVAPGLQTPIALAAYQPVPVATMAAAFTVAIRLPRRTAWIAGGGAALALLGVSLLTRPLTLLATDLVMVFNLVLGTTAVGALIAGRADRLAREVHEREDHTRREVEAERLRIARELHDVLAHSLTLVNAQASVASYLLATDPRAAADALSGLTTHTRRALDELRAAVGLLRQEGDASTGEGSGAGDLRPAPGLGLLSELIDGFRSAGSDVQLSVHGAPRELTPRGDLAAYRIVQESLTNATKHAPGARTYVTVDWTSGDLALRVANDRAIAVLAGHRGRGTGHGLIGMQERAVTAGGTLRTERPAGGGFVVSAVIPVERDGGRADSADQGTGGTPSARGDEP